MGSPWRAAAFSLIDDLMTAALACMGSSAYAAFTLSRRASGLEKLDKPACELIRFLAVVSDVSSFQFPVQYPLKHAQIIR